MTKDTEISNWFDDFIVSINYGTINPMSWGIWSFNKNNYYERVYSYYYDPRKEGCQKTDQIFISEIFQELINLPRFFFAYSKITFLIEPSVAGFIEELKRLANTKYKAKVKIIFCKTPLPDLNDSNIKQDLLYTIRLCLSENVIKLPFNVYRTVENYPDRMLQEISMFLSVSSFDLGTDEKNDIDSNKRSDCNMTVYLITVRDVIDAIYYIKAENEKRAIIKLAQYFGIDINFIENIVDKISLTDMINLFVHYNLDVRTVLQVEYIAALIGTIGNDHVITVVD